MKKLKKDYGIDLTVEIVRDEQVTGVYFSIQLKGTDKLKVRQAGYIAHSCEIKTLRYFLERPELVVYLLYDTQAQKGYWVWIQDFIRQDLGRFSPNWRKQKSATIRISLDNVLDTEAVKQIYRRALYYELKTANVNFGVIKEVTANYQDQVLGSREVNFFLLDDLLLSVVTVKELDRLLLLKFRNYIKYLGGK